MTKVTFFIWYLTNNIFHEKKIEIFTSKKLLIFKYFFFEQEKDRIVREKIKLVHIDLIE